MPRDGGVHPTDTWPDDVPRCTATSQRSGARCRRRPILGGPVCPTHGGLAPQVKAAAAARLDADRAEREVRRLLVMDSDAVPVTDPVGELQKLAGKLNSAVDSLTVRVNALSALEITADSGSEQVRAVVALWERLIRELRGTLTDMARLGIEDRSVRLEEARLHLVVGVIQAVLGGMLAGVTAGLEPVAASSVRAAWGQVAGVVVPRELRALGGGAVGA